VYEPLGANVMDGEAVPIEEGRIDSFDDFFDGAFVL
jgi:hypothetical protein